MKTVYLREIRHETQSEFIVYTTLSVLLRDMGIVILYTTVRSVLLKDKAFTFKNQLIRKVIFKRNPYGKRK